MFKKKEIFIYSFQKVECHQDNYFITLSISLLFLVNKFVLTKALSF